MKNMFEVFIKLLLKWLKNKAEVVRGSYFGPMWLNGFHFLPQYYEHIRKNVDCPALFSNPDIDAYTEYEKALQDIPTYM